MHDADGIGELFDDAGYFIALQIHDKLHDNDGINAEYSQFTHAQQGVGD